jgi:hypothetical protein
MAASAIKLLPAEVLDVSRRDTMHISDAQSTSLILTVTGYQFPALATEPYDSNWLNVLGEVAHPRGAWTFDDACLFTYELERLCTWLAGVAAEPAAKHESLGFTEPNLEFHVLRRRGRAILRVHLGHESASPWLEDRAERIDGVDLDFPIHLNDLGAAARRLREQLSRFPQRAAR